jgi:hypothetical protein
MKSSSIPRRLASFPALALAVIAPIASAAGPDQEAAERVYAEGENAHAKGDFKKAALDFARADEIAPNAQALESALRETLLADDPVLGMILVERAKPAQGQDALAAAVGDVRKAFVARVGRLAAGCDAAAGCRVLLDGSHAEPGIARWVLAGEHVIEVAQGSSTRRQTVTVVAGRSVKVIRISPLPPEPEPARSARLPETWFWAGVGVTFALAGGIGGFASASTHAYNQRDAPALEVTKTATNVLIGATATAGVVTAALGLFVVEWRPPLAARSSARIGVSLAGPGAVLSGSF